MGTARIGTPDGEVTGEYNGESVTADGERYDLTDGNVDLLAPVEPPVCYCAVRNYGSYIEANEFEDPEGVEFFLKPPVAVHPPESTISYRRSRTRWATPGNSPPSSGPSARTWRARRYPTWCAGIRS